jgi:hypothetical protein
MTALKKGVGASAKGDQLIEQRLTAENPGFVSILATAETAWFLNRYTASV